MTSKKTVRHFNGSTTPTAGKAKCRQAPCFARPIIGILGGVCSGKSTVAAEFARLGCKVIDADRIAHQLLGKKTVRKKIIKLFGRKILNTAGEISRRKLANIVFADKDKILMLNKIIHPLVLARAEKLIKQYNHRRRIKAIVLDMPLLIEVGWHKRCDRLIFVNCSRPRRLERLLRSGYVALTKAERAEKTPLFAKKWLKTRENFQIPLDKKVRICDNTIDNNSDLSVLRSRHTTKDESSLVRQVAEVFSRVVNNG
jgi:dephospho-CoA kinase